MTETLGMVRLRPEEEPDGLRNAVAASCRLLASRHEITGDPEVWEWDGLYLAKLQVDGLPEWLTWMPGEPVFVREGGI